MCRIIKLLLLLLTSVFFQGGFAARLILDNNPRAPAPEPLTWERSSLAANPHTFNDTEEMRQARVGCTNGAVDLAELQQALDCLGRWCNSGHKIPPKSGEHCTVGGSMIYCCSYGGWNPCFADELATAWGAIQRDCGQGKGGWWYHPDWKKTYGIDVANADVCGNLG